MSTRVLLLIPTTSYKTDDFMRAAETLGIEVVVGTDRRQALESLAPGGTLAFDLRDLDPTLRRIEELAGSRALQAVIGVDDETTVLAGMAAARLGLSHNPIESVRATRNKHDLRRRLAAAGRPGPRFELVTRQADPAAVASRLRYPVVLKPLELSAGRGVIRADDPDQFAAAFDRIGRLLDDPEIRRLKGPTSDLLVEEYLAGEELAVEGLLDDGRMRVLALFDKPDPLVGPVFEETLLITPSRHPQALQRAVIEETERCCRAIGLVDGPVHAELRITDGRPWLIELAARTIGGICSRSLRFASGASLEELVLRQALGLALPAAEPGAEASGVMMIPIAAAGVLRRIRGVDSARRVAGVVDVTITMHRGDRVLPLPEGNRYPGFIFARGESPAQVESSLRRAHALLSLEIDPL